LDWLKREPDAERREYLKNAELKTVYIYQSAAGAGERAKRGVMAAFFESTNRCHVMFINSYTNAKNNAPSSLQLERILSRQMQQQQEQLPPNLPKYTFFTSRVSSYEEALQELEKLLGDYQDNSIKYSRRAYPTMLIVQSSNISTSALKNHVPSAGTLYPVVRMAGNEQDNEYPAFGWETHCSNFMCARYLQFLGWYSDQIKFSRCSGIPIGNMEADAPTFVTDVYYSRLLVENNHVLWISESCLPDLGQNEDDDDSLSMLPQTCGEEIERPEIVETGCFETICVELDVRGLIINTILESSQINELEGSSMFSSLTFEAPIDPNSR